MSRDLSLVRDDLSKVISAIQKDLSDYDFDESFDTENIEGVGKDDSIAAPNLFYKMVIMESGNEDHPYVLAFLFPHYRQKNDMKENDIFKYLVTVDYLEAITGLDFFGNIDESDQEEFEGRIDLGSWQEYIQ